MRPLVGRAPSPAGRRLVGLSTLKTPARPDGGVRRGPGGPPYYETNGTTFMSRTQSPVHGPCWSLGIRLAQLDQGNFGGAVKAHREAGTAGARRGISLHSTMHPVAESVRTRAPG